MHFLQKTGGQTQGIHRQRAALSGTQTVSYAPRHVLGRSTSTAPSSQVGTATVRHAPRAWQEFGRLPWEGRASQRGAGLVLPRLPQLVWQATPQDGCFLCHSAYLQMSDVVHHSPPFDREALGGDIVVVDLRTTRDIETVKNQN